MSLNLKSIENETTTTTQCLEYLNYIYLTTKTNKIMKNNLDKTNLEITQKLEQQETLEEHNYLQGFINQFEEKGEHQELSNDDWTVSRFLEWLKHNNFKIIKDAN